MPPKAERKRRYHQRSRSGCTSCKQRHMRCDEGKPFCRNCLKNGASCGYPAPASDMLSSPASVSADPTSLLRPSFLAENTVSTSSHVLQSQGLVRPLSISNTSEKEAIFWYSNMRQPSVSTVLSAARTDPFNALPLELSHESTILLDHFTNNRILLRKIVESKRDPELFRFATSDVAAMHGMLVLAANSWMKLGEGCTSLMEPTLYYHKTEAIRIINERLGDHYLATSDGTVGATASLVIMEALNGAAHIARVHLRGLKQLIDLRGDLHSRKMNSYLQRIIMIGDLLTSSALQIKPIFQDSPPPEKTEMKVAVSTSTDAGGNLDYIEKELGVDPEISSMFVELHCVSYLMEQNDNGTYALAKTDLHRSIYDAEKSVDEMLRGGNYEARTVHGVQSNSGCCAISASIYVYRSLRRIPFSSTVYDYLVHLLKQDFEQVEVARTYRQVFPRELLFWIFFVAASSAEGRAEESFFKKELVVSRQALRISTWEVAKFVLKKFAWVEGWNESTDEALFNSLGEL